MTDRGRARRRGTIEDRGDGRWFIRVSLGTGASRQRVCKAIQGTRREAEQELTRLLGEKDQGRTLAASRRTLGQFLEEFEERWARHLSARTKEHSKEILTLYVGDALRGARLSALTAGAFQDLYNSLTEAGKAPATVSLIHRILRARLNKAVELGYVAQNPTTHASPPTVRRTDRRVLTPAEAKLLLDETEEDRFGPLWAVLLLTGMRPGEALGLRWADLDGPQLRVRHSLVRLESGEWRLEETKTRKERIVGLDTVGVRLLQRHKARQAEVKLLLGPDYAADGFIFATDFGKPLDWHTVVNRHFRPMRARLALRIAGKPSARPGMKGVARSARRKRTEEYRAAAQKALQATGLDRLRPYDLRHSAASLLAADGANAREVADLLGHSTTRLTLETYTHLSQGSSARIAKRLEGIIQGPEPIAKTGA